MISRLISKKHERTWRLGVAIVDVAVWVRDAVSLSRNIRAARVRNDAGAAVAEGWEN